MLAVGAATVHAVSSHNHTDASLLGLLGGGEERVSHFAWNA